MLVTPLPWEMTSWRLRRKYAKMWYWLRQNQDCRLAMVGIRTDYDTSAIARAVLQRVDRYTLPCLVNDLIKGLPIQVMESLLKYPISWNVASEHEKYVYLSLFQWLEQKYCEKEIRDLNIDPYDICTER